MDSGVLRESIDKAKMLLCTYAEIHMELEKQIEQLKIHHNEFQDCLNKPSLSRYDTKKDDILYGYLKPYGLGTSNEAYYTDATSSTSN